jgi:predicted nucleic acid-binding protein
LGKQASEIFNAAEQGLTRLIISSIVIAELYYANGKGKLFPDFEETYQQLKTKPYFRFVAFEDEDVLDFDRDVAVPEMHDRIITGLARRIGAPLVTSDPKITAANLVTIIW